MRFFKILLTIFIFIAIVAMGVIFALHSFISSDAIRIKFAQQLSAWTGYNVQIREAPQLNLYPYPKASLMGVTLTPMSDSKQPLMEAERIEVNLSLIEIIFGNISFTQTRIIHPRFIVEEPIQTIAGAFATISASNGALGLAIRNAQEVLGNNPDNFDNSKIQMQPFGLIKIENGELLYQTEDKKYAETIKGINITIDWPVTTSQLFFIAQANWHGAWSELRIEAAQPIALFAGGESQIKASFNSIRGGINFEGRSKILPDYNFEGRIASLSPGLNQSIDWILQNNDLYGNFGIVLAKNITNSVILNSNFTAQANRMQFEDINLSIGNSNMRGLLEINNQQDIPLVTGSLAFDNLSLDDFVSVLNNDTQLNNGFNTLNKINFDTRVSASNLKFATINLTNIAAALQLRNGNATIDLGNALGFGGTLQSTLEFKKIDQEQQGQARITASNINIAELANRLGYKNIINGQANFMFNIQTKFKNLSEMAQNMHGQMNITMQSGQINGYSLSAFPDLLVQNQKITIEPKAQSIYNFDRLNIETDISNDRLTINKANAMIGGWNVESTGQMIRHEKQNSYLLTLQSLLKMPQNNNEICQTILCLQYTLRQPYTLNIAGDIALK